MKTCNACGETKPLDAFRRDSNNKSDGRRAACKACQAGQPSSKAAPVQPQRESLLGAVVEAAARSGKRPEDVTLTDLLAIGVQASETQREIARDAFVPDASDGDRAWAKRHRGTWTAPRPADWKGRRVVVIPDAHAHPDYDNVRFTALGRFLAAVQPDAVVSIGDWADLPALSSYDRGKRSGENRRYRRDVDAATDAQRQMFSAYQAAGGKPAWWAITLGNHEDRIDRLANDQAELDGAVGIEDLGYADFGWHVVPYREALLLGGISFAHFFPSGVMGKPIGGIHAAASLMSKLHTSAVVGHSHLFDHSERTRPDGQKLFGLVVGCYTHPDYLEGWNFNTARMWWRGVVVLEDLDGEGYYDELRAVTLRRIMREHGGRRAA